MFRSVFVAILMFLVFLMPASAQSLQTDTAHLSAFRKPDASAVYVFSLYNQTETGVTAIQFVGDDDVVQAYFDGFGATIHMEFQYEFQGADAARAFVFDFNTNGVTLPAIAFFVAKDGYVMVGIQITKDFETSFDVTEKYMQATLAEGTFAPVPNGFEVVDLSASA